ncbi:MAG: tRNA epoxyqueuosine(34) reductase QueG [Oligoflexus sp.]
MTTIAKNDFRAALQSACEAHGLRLLGIVSLKEEAQEFARYQNWLAKGWHAGMDFLKNYLELRRDPRGLLPGAESAIVLALPYALGDRYQRHGSRPRIAQYARYRDYHKTIQQQGKKLIQWLQREYAADAQYRVVVDSAPLLERAIATRTAKGFIGKNTCYIHPEEGSFLLLGAIVSTWAIEPDEPANVVPSERKNGLGGCGSCRRCQVNCPTGALDEAYQLDANLCLAYWTIEHRGTIPFDFWPWLAQYWFGCDICQLVCPYNRHLDVPESRKKLSRQELESIDLFQVATMSQADYEAWFGGTPLTRAKRSGLRRNALIAMTVTHDPRLEAALELLGDEGVLLETAKQIRCYRRGMTRMT